MILKGGPRSGPELQGTPNMGQTAVSAVSQAASGECQESLLSPLKHSAIFTQDVCTVLRSFFSVSAASFYPIFNAVELNKRTQFSC